MFYILHIPGCDGIFSYRRVEESKDAGDIMPPISWTTDHVHTWLLEHARLISNNVDVMPAISLFDQGFDRYALELAPCARA